MTRAFASIIFSAVLIPCAFTQPTVAPVGFEAADVHVSPKAPSAYMTMAVRGGRYEIHKATMVDLVRIAYGVDSYRVVGGPGWLEIHRFDVVAKVPPNTAPEALGAMLKNLLAERFSLEVRNRHQSHSNFLSDRKVEEKHETGRQYGPPWSMPTQPAYGACARERPV
jgi:hypothetical protein